MALFIKPIPILEDNYAWFLRDPVTGACGVVDPAEEAPIIAAIAAYGGRLDRIFLTHHHADHIAAADVLRARYGALVIGAAADAHRLPPLDIAVKDGDNVALGAADAVVIDTPGHTRGHVSYFFPATPALFCGDTLFSMGCGRLFEGTADEMFHSLRRIAALPDDMLICCGHEYTLSNARFAMHVDPANVAVAERMHAVQALRARDMPTLPVTLGEERRTNPFLRACDARALATLRQEKDVFR
ncbi:hydroxyacylglutathione hydrolase [Novacetimonas hansenii]|uniref:Hydroxyacylglutathione hydrolase n=2 Tax=Novacetimonas hansenii TaxID=436 RepID=A0AAW5ES74_NOVHA|nr:hydroxyacylglutathione hydrolase [Novacetimonas hansenii]EFG83618.1 hydroxyacylglutathione hydrolase [Novacetimonas hansenii ATCC 23769]MCJ8354449.1 hydroxyacylglutathione hydrolase [Novacetimonas hansenii]GAN82581.1 hydroxyacylglutathione hydrolase [Novacetimonas hansenii JCM 7643]GBQ62245.1 hydroxyacylglutathione hydrolase [Novacetimonas hansenii NRIC 0243]GEC62606.1 hydroxyacylglutathione hydrolase [Novacetimonas hansenii]